MRCLLSILFILSFFAVSDALPQDEFYFRKMFLKKKVKAADIDKKKKVYDLQATTPLYKVDLNRDSTKEGIIYHKDNGHDRVHILSDKGKIIKSFELDTYGKNSALQRVLIKKLSSETDVMILYFFAGVQEYIEFKAQGRLYFINIDKRNLNKMKIYKGPSYWSEVKDGMNNYHQRHYKLDLKDLNGDGVKEILVRYSNISEVCYYIGVGKWKCGS